MAKFEVSWTTENWHKFEVEADSEDDALAALLNSGKVFSDETVYEFDYLQDGSIEVKEIEEEAN